MIEAFVQNELATFMAVVCYRMSDASRKEFSDAVTIKLAKVPFNLLVPAVDAALESVSFPERFLPFVFDQVRESMDRLQLEGERLQALVDMRDG